MNMQTYEILVVSGEELEQIKQGNVAKLNSGTPLHPESERSQPPEITGVYRERQVELGSELFRLMSIDRRDMKARQTWYQKGFRYFDAPVVVFILADKMVPQEVALLNIGLLTQTLCLSALEYELGTSIELFGVSYPEVVRGHLDIPQTKRIVISIAIGYPDQEFPANQIRTKRARLEEILTWYGF